MKKKRRTLDTKDHGGAKPGDVRNPEGKRVGTLARSTVMSNEVKTTLMQTFQRTLAPQILATMLNMKLPMQVVPRHIREKWVKGEELTKDEDIFIAHTIMQNWKWALDWYAKVFPKTMGVFGMDQTGEETLAGRVKQATKATKSANVIDLVKRQREKEMYSAERT